jgi:hypothetical protein
MATRPRRTPGKALLLASWNADGFRCRKLELEQFPSKHGVDICLLNEIHLETGRALRFTNCLCHRTDRTTPGGGTAIFVHKGIDHYAVPVSGLQYLEATATNLVLVARPVKLVSAYLAHTRPLVESDLTECLSRGIPVLMAGDRNAKHKDWNSRLTTARGPILRDYADRNSCLIYVPDSPTTAPYTHNSTPDVLGIVVVKDLVLPVHLTVCSALSSDHLPILIDTSCRSSFHNLPDRPDFTRTDWAAFQTCLEHRLPGNPVVVDEEVIDKCLEELTSANHEATAASAPRRRPRADPRPPLSASIQDEIRLKNRLRRQWQITRDPALKAQINRLQRSVTWRLNEWRTGQWSDALESLCSEDQSLWKMTKRVMRVPTPSSRLQGPGELALKSQPFPARDNALQEEMHESRHNHIISHVLPKSKPDSQR